MAAVADLVVIRINFEHVLVKRIRVEHLADGRIHQGQQRVGRDVRIAVERDARNDGIFDHPVGDGDAAGTLTDQRNGQRIGKVAEV